MKKERRRGCPVIEEEKRIGDLAILVWDNGKGQLGRGQAAERRRDRAPRIEVNATVLKLAMRAMRLASSRSVERELRGRDGALWNGTNEKGGPEGGEEEEEAWVLLAAFIISANESLRVKEEALADKAASRIALVEGGEEERVRELKEAMSTFDAIIRFRYTTMGPFLLFLAREEGTSRAAGRAGQAATRSVVEADSRIAAVMDAMQRWYEDVGDSFRRLLPPSSSRGEGRECTRLEKWMRGLRAFAEVFDCCPLSDWTHAHVFVANACESLGTLWGEALAWQFVADLKPESCNALTDLARICRAHCSPLLNLRGVQVESESGRGWREMIECTVELVVERAIQYYSHSLDRGAGPSLRIFDAFAFQEALLLDREEAVSADGTILARVDGTFTTAYEKLTAQCEKERFDIMYSREYRSRERTISLNINNNNNNNAGEAQGNLAGSSVFHIAFDLIAHLKEINIRPALSRTCILHLLCVARLIGNFYDHQKHFVSKGKTLQQLAVAHSDAVRLADSLDSCTDAILSRVTKDRCLSTFFNKDLRATKSSENIIGSFRCEIRDDAEQVRAIVMSLRESLSSLMSSVTDKAKTVALSLWNDSVRLASNDCVEEAVNRMMDGLIEPLGATVNALDIRTAEPLTETCFEIGARCLLFVMKKRRNVLEPRQISSYFAKVFSMYASLALRSASEEEDECITEEPPSIDVESFVPDKVEPKAFEAMLPVPNHPIAHAMRPTLLRTAAVCDLLVQRKIGIRRVDAVRLWGGAEILNDFNEWW